MNNKNMVIGFAVIAVVLAAAFGAFGSTGSTSLTDTGAISSPNPMALPYSEFAIAQTLVKIYSQPTSSSKVVNVIAPASEMSVLGLSVDGRYLAIAGVDSDEILGWVNRQDVAARAVIAMTNDVTRVYSHADTTSQIVDLLPPASRLHLLGISADGGYYAISTDADSQINGFVVRENVNSDDMLATTNTLTMVYRKIAGTDSDIVTVLPPGELVRITGKNASGAWVSVNSADGEIWSGWINVGALEIDGNLSGMPTLSIK